jgi:hypothetical protein
MSGMAYRIVVKGKKEELVSSVEAAMLLAKDIATISGKEAVIIEDSPAGEMMFSKKIATIRPSFPKSRFSIVPQPPVPKPDEEDKFANQME